MDKTTAPRDRPAMFKLGSRLSVLSLLTLLLVCLPSAAALALPVEHSFDLVDRNNEGIILDTTEPPALDIFRRDETANFTLPRPFDTSLGNNFTSSGCLPFFESFLSNDTFNACSPMSLLLQTSSGFFTAQRTPSLLNATIDASCNVNMTDCSQLMATLNTQLRSESVCGPDLDRGNPTVGQAAAGFSSYDVLYKATCLRDTTTGKYCFAEAAGNVSAPTSIYTYYLPLGLNLPAQAQPACNQCLRNTMDIFALAATESGQAIAGDYTSAAKTVTGLCGQSYARLDVKVAAKSSDARNLRVTSWHTAIFLCAAAVFYHGLF
ncbi:hypothetical protein ANO11243_013880 [Dothideomycetidae sp. 11243]|nr:hypothetical protein ANO11243_013880 [fungal sp. No.11243]